MDKALLTRVRKQSWFHTYPRGWPFLLFVLASVATAVSVIAIERAEAERRELELDRNVTEIASALQRRAVQNIALLSAGTALFETQDTVSLQQFRDFAANMQTDGNLYGSRGMGWAPLVDSDTLIAFEMATREAEGIDFMAHPRPGPEQAVLVPITYLVPENGQNRQAIGYDLYSEESRRAAIEEAVRSRAPAATGKLRQTGFRGQDRTADFMIFAPVAGRRGSGPIKGFVFSPFSAEEFLASSAELYRDRPVEIMIHDGEKNSSRLLAHRTQPGANGLTQERRIRIADREWLLTVSNKETGALTPLSRLTLFFGAVAALLVMAIGRLITKRAVEDRQVLEWLSRQAAIRDSLTRELNHRVKNTLANVLSIAALTRRRSNDIDDFFDSLTGRIKALSATHDLLSQANWGHAQLGDVVRSELAPYTEGDQSHTDLAGPDIPLAPNDAMSLGLAIHELATNAAKYGALSVPEGRIRVRWSRLSPDLAEVHWREEGGPEVCEPRKRGFGRDLIEKIVAHELQAPVDLRFNPGGVECTLQVAVRKVSEFSLRAQRQAAAG